MYAPPAQSVLNNMVPKSLIERAMTMLLIVAWVSVIQEVIQLSMPFPLTCNKTAGEGVWTISYRSLCTSYFAVSWLVAGQFVGETCLTVGGNRKFEACQVYVGSV